MTKIKIVLGAAALALPLVSFAGLAGAATAHNLQSGTRTSNAYDSMETAYTKQVSGYQNRTAEYGQPAGVFGR